MQKKDNKVKCKATYLLLHIFHSDLFRIFQLVFWSYLFRPLLCSILLLYTSLDPGNPSRVKLGRIYMSTMKIKNIRKISAEITDNKRKITASYKLYVAFTFSVSGISSIFQRPFSIVHDTDTVLMPLTWPFPSSRNSYYRGITYHNYFIIIVSCEMWIFTYFTQCAELTGITAKFQRNFFMTVIHFKHAWKLWPRIVVCSVVRWFG